MKNRKFLKKFIPAAVLIFCLTGASIYTVFIQPMLDGDKYIYIEEAVERGDLFLGIMESGEIELKETTLDYTLELETSGEESEEDEEEEDGEETIKYLEIEKVYASGGQRIKEGDSLFKLTQDSMNAVRKKLNTLYIEKQIALAEAETDFKIQKLQAKSTYDTSILEADRAASSYNASSTKTQESFKSLKAEIAVLEAEITYYNKQLAEEELWEDLEDAQTAYTSAKNVYEDTDVHNATAYASNYADYKSAKEQLKSIQDQIEDLKEGISENEKKIETYQEKIAETGSSLEVESLTDESAYESAVLGGELAEDIYNYTVNSLQEIITAAESEKEEAERNLKEFDDFVGKDGVIYADGTGLVTDVFYSEGENLINPGAMVSYVKENDYEVTIDVSEEDISVISVGDKVDIVMAAYPDEIYEGIVTSITTAAASDYAATVSYPVTIKVEGDTSLLYGGMTAEVTFVTDSVTDVLFVSKKAVQEKDGKSYVYVKDGGGGKTLTEVKTGFSDGADIEIVSGLTEGDVVYMESKINASEAELKESNTGNTQSVNENPGELPQMDNIPGINNESDVGNSPNMENRPDSLGMQESSERGGGR